MATKMLGLAVKRELDEEEDDCKLEQIEAPPEMKRAKEEGAWNWVMVDDDQGASSSAHKEHNGPPKFICELCGVQFNAMHGLRYHTNREHATQFYPCGYPGCRQYFYNGQELHSHFESHSFALFTCTNCNNFESTSKKQVDVHKAACSVFRCVECDIIFQREWMLVSHNKIHARKHCNVCQGQHADPCVCLRCHAHFECEDEYQLHELQCTLPWTCGVCKAPFADKAVVLVHLKSGTHRRSEMERARIWDRFPFFERGAPTRCDICDTTIKCLKPHIVRHHKNVMQPCVQIAQVDIKEEVIE